MNSKFIENFQKKSLRERFLLVIGILFFLIYLAFGLIVVFWDSLPISKYFTIAIPSNYRIVFGILLIVYSFFRFLRFFNKD